MSWSLLQSFYTGLTLGSNLTPNGQLCICQQQFLLSCSPRNHCVPIFYPLPLVNQSTGPVYLISLGERNVMRGRPSSLLLFHSGYLFIAWVTSCLSGTCLVYNWSLQRFLILFQNPRENQNGGFNELQLWVWCRACHESVFGGFRGRGPTMVSIPWWAYPLLHTRCKAFALSWLQVTLDCLFSNVIDIFTCILLPL